MHVCRRIKLEKSHPWPTDYTTNLAKIAVTREMGRWGKYITCLSRDYALRLHCLVCVIARSVNSPRYSTKFTQTDLPSKSVIFVR